jgi:hypothetical protein
LASSLAAAASITLIIIIINLRSSNYTSSIIVHLCSAGKEYYHFRVFNIFNTCSCDLGSTDCKQLTMMTTTFIYAFSKLLKHYCYKKAF